MLRSFEYMEQSYSDVQLQSDRFREEEIRIAKLFCDSHSHETGDRKECPVCSKGMGRHFYNKWDVEYLYCEECGSIYVSCSDELLNTYINYERKVSLRLGDKYQKAIEKRRKQHWEEFLQWVQFRTFRFLGKKEGISIIDIGNRYRDYVELIKLSELCGEYQLVDSILKNSKKTYETQAELIFYLDNLKQEQHPEERLREIADMLQPKGLLIIGARAGSGFDILTLREHNRNIYPYEHILLPSAKGLVSLLQRLGYRILEISTPGIMDVQYVKECINYLDDSNLFVRRMLESNDSILQEFQRFLQKSGMSSYVQIIAQKAE